MTTDTRTEAERRYDAERAGTLYTPAPPAEDPLIVLARRYDEHPDPQILVEMDRLWAPRRIGAVTGRLAGHLLDLCAADEMQEVEELINQVEALIAGDDVEAPAIRIKHMWADEDGDWVDEPIGPLAVTYYQIGEDDDDDKAEVAFYFTAARYEPNVYLFGQEGVDLDQVERTLDNLLALLKTPEVLAARATDAERRKAA